MSRNTRWASRAAGRRGVTPVEVGASPVAGTSVARSSSETTLSKMEITIWERAEGVSAGFYGVGCGTYWRQLCYLLPPSYSLGVLSILGVPLLVNCHSGPPHSSVIMVVVPVIF